MAIYSLRLTPIGKTTQQRPFTAAAHVRYITRKDAMTLSMAERMPETGARAMRWLKAEEKADRKNARVSDKMIMALPRELSADQQAKLVYDFAEALTQRRASWFAAIHAKGKDRDNPHCHLIVRDRDIVTGRRVVMFSAGAKEIKQRAATGEKSPTTLRMIRALWEEYANAALEAYEATVQGFASAGRLWTINTMVNLDDELTGATGAWLVTRVTFTRSRAGGHTTSLRLVPRGALVVEPDPEV